MKINLIVAVMSSSDGQYVIAVDGKVPWHQPGDLKHFKSLTMGDAVICGRKTLETLPLPLFGRDVFVVSNSLPVSTDTYTVRGSLSSALAAADARGCRTAWVIGGGELYAEAIKNHRIEYAAITFIQTSSTLELPPGQRTTIDLRLLVEQMGFDEPDWFEGMRPELWADPILQRGVDSHSIAYLFKNQVLDNDLRLKFMG